MTTAALTAADVHLRDAVIRELDWDPEVDDSAIGVAARAGVVTLTGEIDTYAGKLAAERVVKRLKGVTAVANDILVRLKADVTDSDVAAGVAQALKLGPGIPPGVQAAVHGGHVTLTGRVDWLNQISQIEAAARHVPGVRAVLNHIEVTPKPVPDNVRHRILEALHRSAELDARRVEVTVTGDVVELTGEVSSWMQRNAAELGAGSAPGIRRVDNRLRVVPVEPYPFPPPADMQ